jgi:hypothetical protein
VTKDCFSSTFYRNETFNYTIKESYEEFYTKHGRLEFCIFNYTQVISDLGFLLGRKIQLVVFF